MKILDSLPISSSPRRGSNIYGHITDALADGKPRVLESGVDFKCKPHSFAQSLYQIGKKLGFCVTARCLPSGDVAAQFTPRNGKPGE